MEKKRILDQLGRGFLGLLSLSCTFASIREEAFAGVGDVSTSQAQVQTLLKKPPEFFADLYSEESALGQAKTLTTYTQVRAGLKTQSQLEFYGSARFGADSRTMFEKGTSVYNDNYLFLGAGVDYLGLLPGVRTVFQVGVSKDLSNKLDAGGLDGRVGVVTYHEIHPEWTRDFYSEIYSEALYIQRYKNVMVSGQFRAFYSGFKSSLLFGAGAENKLRIEPTLNAVVSGDSSGYDFNRFVEARMGIRFKYTAGVDLMLVPHYVLGARYQTPTQYPSYQDFRLLFVLSKNL